MSLSTGADSPDKITHGFVLAGGDLVWSMLNGQGQGMGKVAGQQVDVRDSKFIENRCTRLAPGWYAVIQGKGNKGETPERYAECKARLPNMNIPAYGSVDLSRNKGCVVGIARIAHSLPYEHCKDSVWAVEAYKVCNIISHAGWIDVPVPCKGNLGACPIKDDETRDRVRALAQAAYEYGNIHATEAELKYPWSGEAVWDEARRKRKASTASIDLEDKDGAGKLRAFLLDDKASMEATQAAQTTAFFYSHTKGPYRCFSNFYPSDLVMSHPWHPTCRGEFAYHWGEQAIMHAKALLMGDIATALEIMRADSPKQCKALGRKVKPFDDDKWKKHVPDIAFEVLRCKFEQNPALSSVLSSTGDLPIAEAAANDKIWAIGLSEKEAALGTPWRGANLLGETLMRVRAYLAAGA
tara:strand:+ start:4698 stop:5927 length:1230 start_codon:yes stop_codon:yes gene_type:complete